MCAPPNSKLVSWIDGDFKHDDQIGDQIKMVDNESSSIKSQNFLQTKWIDGDFKGDEQLGDHIKMVDNESSSMNTQNFV